MGMDMRMGMEGATGAWRDWGQYGGARRLVSPASS